MNSRVDAPLPELHEGQPMWGRRVFLTGASQGPGRAIARMALDLGASVTVGASNLESFNSKAVPVLGTNRVTPFIADLSEPDNVIDRIQEFIASSNGIPTDIIFSAAAGLKAVLTPVKFDVARLMRKKDQEKAEGLKHLKTRIQELVQADEQRSFMINSASHVLILGELFKHLQRGSRVIFLSSLYSDLYGRDDFTIPDFYQGVAKTKHHFIEFLTKVAPGYQERGIHLAILSGHLLSDTEAGQMLIWLGNLLPDVIYFPDDIKANLPTTSDMVDETKSLLLSDPQTWRVPHFRYVVAKGKVVDSIDPNIPELARIKINL